MCVCVCVCVCVRVYVSYSILIFGITVIPALSKRIFSELYLGIQLKDAVLTDSQM